MHEYMCTLFSFLQGNHGFKRFLKDGHHTVKEDTGKKYYDQTELTVSYVILAIMAAM